MPSILILDGCPLTRECLSMLLRDDGFQVFSVPDNAQAKAHLLRRPPDILLCELVVSDGSTLGLLRWIKQEKRFGSMRVCVLTNIAAKTPLTQAVEAGAGALMLKSRFSYKGLVRQLNDLVGRSVERTAKASASASGSVPSARFPLPMPAPDPLQDLKRYKPLLSRGEMERALSERPRLSCSVDVVARVRSILQSDTCEMESIAGALHGDPGLMVRLFEEAVVEDGDGCEEPASGAFDALIRVGLDRLTEILDEVEAEAEQAEEASPKKSSASLTPDELRAHGLAVGIIAARIAEQSQGVDPRWAMTGGLLHDIGRLRLLEALPNKTLTTTDICATLGVPIQAGERRLLLTEHDKLGLSMCSELNLPRDVTQAIGFHHEEPARMGPSKLCACVALADAIAHALGYGYSGSTTIEPSEQLFAMLDETLTLDGIVGEGLGEEIESALKHAGLSTELLTNGVRHSMPSQPIHPCFISAEPDHDIHGLWLRTEFGEPDESRPANIAVVHVRQAKDRAELGERLEQIQADLRARGEKNPLPVLMLSPTGRRGLPEEIMARHLCMHLRTPFGVSTFERAVNALMSGKQQYTETDKPSMAA